MPIVNFEEVDDATDFSPLPDGKYVCVINDIEKTVTKSNDEMWKLKFEVCNGTYKGRIIYDNMIFSEKALPRVKAICLNMGVDVSGELDLQPDMLRGQEVCIEVFEDEYHDRDGKAKKKNSVPYSGYSVAGNISSEVVTDDDIPF